MKTRQKVIAAAAIMLALALTGCANQGMTGSGNGINTFTVTLSDGRTVECVSISAGGVDCDWEGSRR